jgi:hypothetical protein
MNKMGDFKLSAQLKGHDADVSVSDGYVGRLWRGWNDY